MIKKTKKKLTKEQIQMTNKLGKNCLYLTHNQEIQTETRYHFFFEIDKVKKKKKGPHCWQSFHKMKGP